eukprot:GHRR01011373.1.p1 GENE.GHRR01011373.1~~GHRR01011373.1.p1  ORF type:complete len:144 (+),score=25.70 GHRR01011373.1:442-873(+)
MSSVAISSHKSSGYREPTDEQQPLGVAGRVQLVAFCVFEILIGMFWPSMMTLRAKYVPEEERSTIINIFRIPLNVFVCIILWRVSELPLGVLFALCSAFLVCAAGCQYQLSRIANSKIVRQSDISTTCSSGNGYIGLDCMAET